MPVRTHKEGEPQPQPDINPQDESIPDELRPKQPPLVKIAALGVEYKRLKKEDEKNKKALDSKNKLLKQEVKDSKLYRVSDKGHFEIKAPLGDGLNEVFVQIQNVNIVKPVDNLMDLLKAKLGASLDPYIMQVETLHPNTLTQLYAQGKISEKELEDYTVTTTQERLFVEINKQAK